MNTELTHAAKEWFEWADHDYETAQLLHDEQGYADAIAFHIQQAAEKYLKGLLAMRGQCPPKGHDLEALLNLAAAGEPDLYAPFIDFCRKAAKYYGEEGEPPSPLTEYALKEIEVDLCLLWQLVNTIREKAGL